MRLAEKIPDEKLDRVMSYLKAKFLGYDVNHYYDGDLRGHTFHLTGENKRLTIRRAFFDKYCPSRISMFLEGSGLCNDLRKEDITRILVEGDGSIFSNKK